MARLPHIFKSTFSASIYPSGKKLPSLRFSLLLFLPFLALPAQAQIGAMAGKGAARAVIVGISDYEDERIPRLKFAHRDAQAMADFLQSGAGGKLPAENIRLLLNEKATRGEIAVALYWLVEQSKAGDRAIIYFSGHGDVENKIMMDQGYLLAYDARASNYMGSGTYPVEMLHKVIQTLSLGLNAEVIMIADACRAGKLAGSETGGVVATNQGLAQRFANEIRILSCEPEQASLEGEQWGGGRGLFSYFLIDGLKGLADEKANKNLKVELRELESFLKEEVSKQADQYPITRGPGGAELFRVDEDTLLALLERGGLGSENIAFASPRSMLPAVGDTAVHPLYQQFQQAVAEGRLLYPEQGSAFSLFQQMQQVEALQPLLSALRLNLAAALQDGAQRAINAYLEASPEEMARRWQYDRRYHTYPEYLDKAAGLIGPGNILYDDLRARQAYFEGLALRLQGETLANGDSLFQLAIQKQELALSMDSLAAHAYNELGLAYQRLKKYRRSLEFFEKAHALSPTWAIPPGNISASLLDMGRYDESAGIAEQALSLKADYVPPRCNLGKIAFLRGDYRKAIDYARQSIAYDSAFANAYFLLGDSWTRLDSFEQSQEAFHSYLRHSAQMKAAVHTKQGFNARKMGQFDQAQSYYEAAIGTDPQYAPPYFNLGNLFLISLENPQEAEGYYRQYLQLEPEDAEGMVLLACCLASREGLGEALQWLEQALEAGFKNLDGLRATPLLQNLQSDPRFLELLSRFEH